MNNSEELIEDASHAIKNKRYEFAISILDKYLRENPECVIGWGKLGQAYKGNKQYSLAVECFRKALAKEPWSTRSKLGLALSLYDDENYEESGYYLREVLEVENKTFLWILLGETQKAQGRIEDAKSSFRYALTIESDNTEALNSLADLLKDKCPEDALDLFNKTIAIDPCNCFALREMAYILDKYNNRPDEAKSFLRKAIRYDNGSSWNHLYMANVLWREKNIDEAEREYRKAYAIDPCPFVQALLGDFFVRIGRRKEGIALLEDAYHRDNSDRIILEMLNRSNGVGVSGVSTIVRPDKNRSNEQKENEDSECPEL